MRNVQSQADGLSYQKGGKEKKMSHRTGPLAIAFAFSAGLDLPICPGGSLGQAAVTGGADSNRQVQTRERAMDRVVHIEEGVIQEIPAVPRLCDGMNIRKEKVDIGDCQLYCEQEGQGTPLALLHGGPGATHHDFHPFFSQAKNFARVIYYDQRGCGLSDYRPGKGYTVDQAVDDLEHLRQALQIDQWVVLGHSYGGLLAQCYATKYPDKLRGLVLVGASTGLPIDSSSRDDQFISRQEREKMDEIRATPGLSLAQNLYNLHLNGDWKRQSYSRPSRERIAQMVLYEWVHDGSFRSSMGPSISKVDLEGIFTQCPIPTLLLEGKWDMSWGENKAHLFHQNHPRSRLVIFEESAHCPFEDEPERFFSELEKFVSTLKQATSQDLAAWTSDLTKREALVGPLSRLGWGRKSNQEIASKYDKTWLDQAGSFHALLKIGFALYDVKRYNEALAVFEKMQEQAGENRSSQAVALIWQGHMLDLLGKREEAISRYHKAAGMGAQDWQQNDQFGLAYSPSPYAGQRIDTPFARVENRDSN
jgi:proline iminopeptidase